MAANSDVSPELKSKIDEQASKVRQLKSSASSKVSVSLRVLFEARFISVTE